MNTAPTGQEDWHSVHHLSPGQRSTALLSLARTAGDEPLLIDQPEDDLDNRYIFAEVVQVLARVCQRRQVIVATHNANIPILGDAEMIVALDAGSDKGTVLAAGGLEDPKVTEQARHIRGNAIRRRHAFDEGLVPRRELGKAARLRPLRLGGIVVRPRRTRLPR